jgi:hypothetical protein
MPQPHNTPSCHVLRPFCTKVFDGKEERIAGLLPELLDAYALRPARAGAGMPLRWLHSVTNEYGTPPQFLDGSGRWEGAWRSLADGVWLAQLAHYYGVSERSVAAASGAVDMSLVYFKARTRAQRLSNLRLALPVLAAAGAPLVVTEALLLGTGGVEEADEEGGRADDDDVALLQIQLLHDALAHRQTSLPTVGRFADVRDAHDELRAGLVQGVDVGVAQIADGAGGERQVVVGFTYADTEPWTEEELMAQASARPAAPVATVVSHGQIEDEWDVAAQAGASGASHAIAAGSSRRGSYGPAVVLAGAVVREAAIGAVHALEDDGRAVTAAEVAGERDRLLSIALARATGERARSSAVIAVALKWANDKARAWATSLHVDAAVVDAALSAQAAAAPAPAPTDSHVITAAAAQPTLEGSAPLVGSATQAMSAATTEAGPALHAASAECSAPSSAAAGADSAAAAVEQPAARAYGMLRQLAPSECRLLPEAPEVLRARDRSGMAREEKLCWEGLLREADAGGDSVRLPLRGGLFAISQRTQPLRLRRHRASPSRGHPIAASPPGSNPRQRARPSGAADAVGASPTVAGLPTGSDSEADDDEAAGRRQETPGAATALPASSFPGAPTLAARPAAGRSPGLAAISPAVVRPIAPPPVTAVASNMIAFSPLAKLVNAPYLFLLKVWRVEPANREHCRTFRAD